MNRELEKRHCHIVILFFILYTVILLNAVVSPSSPVRNISSRCTRTFSFVIRRIVDKSSKAARSLITKVYPTARPIITLREDPSAQDVINRLQVSAL